jgi:hypothetical protein
LIRPIYLNRHVGLISIYKAQHIKPLESLNVQIILTVLCAESKVLSKKRLLLLDENSTLRIMSDDLLTALNKKLL